ncbi:MAG: hypothetical protein Q8R33_15175 [Burkholderiales bacterium]|nr:hypothetical protein [Burkholderiales bacterium]
MDAPSSSNEEWFGRFTTRLRELRPSLIEQEAAEVAQVAFDSASDLEPEDAAAVFGEILNARVPVHDLKRWMTKKESPLRRGH